MSAAATESRNALVVVTSAATRQSLRLLNATTGAPTARRAELLTLLPQVIDYYSLGSAALAADFYDESRVAAGAAGRFSAEPVLIDRMEKVGRALAWATEPLMGADGDTEARLAEVVDIETARPYRDTILGNRRRDKQAVGWVRITHGGCSFCQMLAGRGAVYREESVRFASHAHCKCTAAPVFRSNDTGEEASVLQYVASKKRKSAAERRRLREYLAENYPAT